MKYFIVHETSCIHPDGQVSVSRCNTCINTKGLITENNITDYERIIAHNITTDFKCISENDTKTDSRYEVTVTVINIVPIADD